MNTEQIKIDLLILKELTKSGTCDAKTKDKFLATYPINSDFSSLLSILHSDNPEYDLNTIANLIVAECKKF